YPSSRTPKNVYPKVKRNYGQANQRVRAEDLKDNDSDGSLWSGKNSESFLFVTNNIKKPGDIVIIDVLSKLKDDITEELKRAYPDPPKKKKKDDKAEGEQENVADAAAAPAEGSEKEVHDKISTQVVESVNKDYLLLRGRKEVLFKNAKRYVEVQALVSRKDIADNDTVKSNRMLEPKIRVLRY
ncbi:MAG: flagellar basal body L-ring protein FlgH, partial [Bacteriovoracaceae bacterium]|nr:flagellar basal body L-ring protein FlgH [Bacteriovoracaceae bacterium]